MEYQLVRGDIKNTEDPKELAKAIWDFYLFQYDVAMINDIEVRAELQSYYAANQSAADEYRQNNEFGWGPPQPYSQSIIDVKKHEAANAARNLIEAKALLNFVKDRFLDKWS